MRRRDVLAGVASAGVLGAGVAVALAGPPSTDALTGADDSDDPPEPMEVETVEATGSEAGTVLVPDPDQPTFIDFFGTWCPPCVEQMPALGAAYDRVGDDVQFLSVTNEAIGRSITREELADWWDDHDGRWTIGLDPAIELNERYNPALDYPKAVAIDTERRVQWSDSGIKTADELVDGIERAIESSSPPA